MNWCIFLGHECSIFDAIANHLIALKILKNQKLAGLCPQKLHQDSAPDPKLQLRLLHNRFVPYKTQFFSTKRTLAEVLG